MQNIVSSFKNLLRILSACCPSDFCGGVPCPAVLVYSTVLFVAAASPAISSPVAGDDPGIPHEFGQVIYRINADSPKQLYIVGISHRDPETRRNGDHTVDTQAEIFRIGEWLNRHRDLQLLLPEGYFTPAEACPVVLAEHAPIRLDNDLLRQRLADENHFVNAEMLLLENCRLHASQVEDRSIYNAVYNTLRGLKSSGKELPAPEERLAQLQYLQEIRTAVLLQKIPSIIAEELNNGRIDRQSAMFTIGLNHIKDIVRYFQNSEIRIEAPAGADDQESTFSSDLDLLKKGYGVTVILPRTLAEDRALLQMTSLDRNLLVQSDR